MNMFNLSKSNCKNPSNSLWYKIYRYIFLNKCNLFYTKFNFLGFCNKLSIGTKLLIILLLVSFLPLFIITYEFDKLGKTKLTEQTIHVLKVQAENVSISIKRYLEYKYKHLYRIANIPQLIQVLKKSKKDQPRIASQVISYFRDKLRIDPDFLSILLLDNQGNVVRSEEHTSE